MENMKIPSITDIPQLERIYEPVSTGNQPAPVKQRPQIASGDVNFEADKLLKALYWLWDGFERSNVPFFLTGQTYEDVVNDRDLSGNRVTVGVRRVEWVSGGARVLRTFIGEPTSEDAVRACYRFEGVPIDIEIYDDHDCIIGTDSVSYRYEVFKVPNPYETFKKIYK